MGWISVIKGSARSLQEVRTIKKIVKRPKHQRKDWWIGSAQVLVDDNGYARAALIHEGLDRWLLVAPLGCYGTSVTAVPGASQERMKRIAEKQLRNLGYLPGLIQNGGSHA